MSIASTRLRNYEIVIVIHPDQSDQVPTIIERYQHILTQDEGQVHRLEDWGRRHLAYEIEKVRKGHYLLINVACKSEIISYFHNLLTQSDAVLRYLITRLNVAITTPSAGLLYKQAQELQEANAASAHEKHTHRHKYLNSQSSQHDQPLENLGSDILSESSETIESIETISDLPLDTINTTD